jgi:hypothetical protein
MKNKFLTILVVLVIVISCKKAEKVDEVIVPENNVSSKEQIKVDEVSVNIICEDKDTLEYQNDKISVYNEYKMRGDGVAILNVNDKIEILNQDNTIFGEITVSEEEGYQINLQNKIVARSFVPEFDKFYFDAEEPNKSDEFVILYINKEQKKIKNIQDNYKFQKWEDFVKGDFIKLRGCNNISKSKKDINTYSVLEIYGDSMKVKSASKNDCDAIEDYTNLTKKIKWKKNDFLLIDLYSCN